MSDADKKLQEEVPPAPPANADDAVLSEPASSDLPKPDQVPARDEKDEQYYQDHKGLPTVEERPDQEVQADEEQQLSERAEAKKAMDAEAAESGTLATAAAAATVVSPKSPEQQAVEGVLQDGLEEAYSSMNSTQQQTFKQTGEATASKVTAMLYSSKVKVGKILELIRNWLKNIPGVNKFFLEQQSKIKTDELLRLKKQKEEEGPMQ